MKPPLISFNNWTNPTTKEFLRTIGPIVLIVIYPPEHHQQKSTPPRRRRSDNHPEMSPSLLPTSLPVRVPLCDGWSGLRHLRTLGHWTCLCSVSHQRVQSQGTKVNYVMVNTHRH